jgi:hypothetical protein
MFASMASCCTRLLASLWKNTWITISDPSRLRIVGRAADQVAELNVPARVKILATRHPASFSAADRGPSRALGVRSAVHHSGAHLTAIFHRDSFDVTVAVAIDDSLMVGYASRTRFIPDVLLDRFERTSWPMTNSIDKGEPLNNLLYSVQRES